jgi:hypothetical protein
MNNTMNSNPSCTNHSSLPEAFSESEDEPPNGYCSTAQIIKSNNSSSVEVEKVRSSIEAALTRAPDNENLNNSTLILTHIATDTSSDAATSDTSSSSSDSNTSSTQPSPKNSARSNNPLSYLPAIAAIGQAHIESAPNSPATGPDYISFPAGYDPSSPAAQLPAAGVSVSWVNPKLEARVSNTGSGIFALQKISAGETLIVWTGRIVSAEQALQIMETPDKHYILQIGDGFYQCPLQAAREPADWTNHSWLRQEFSYLPLSHEGFGGWR